MKFSEVLRRLDAYPKTMEDISVRTISGATITIVSTILIILLIALEYQAYNSPVVREELFVDTTRNDKLHINLDITVSRVSCAYLSVDAMDSGGDTHARLEQNIMKQRLDLEGNIIDEPPKKLEILTKKDKEKNITNAVESTTKFCSCYGAEANETHCCSTCEDVLAAYREKRWEAKPEKFQQCQDMEKTDKNILENVFKEGCRLYGKMEVTRMEGTFHIAPGKGFSFRRVHVHEVNPEISHDFNMTHHINHLSFGEKTSLVKTHPLDGTVVLDENKHMTMFQYFIKIVPTMYVKSNGETLQTNQFSVTKDQRKIATGDPGLIALFFSYELSPLMVKYTEKSHSFGHFATNVCSIIGGVFTVAGILVSFLHNSMEVLEKKIELGKLS